MTPIRAGGGQLWQGDQPFRFVGTNCYFLQEEGAREVLGWEGHSGRVDEALRKAAALQLGVVRAWAFHDDPANPATIQLEPGRYNEAGLGGVDLSLERAAVHGVRLLLSLGNYWPDYGGIAQYARWHGCSEAEFFTAEAPRRHYADHLSRLLERRNPRTGFSWGEDPSVLAWELMNEPRCGDVAAAAFVDWVGTMAEVVRSSASQLVATGEEGLDPTFSQTSLLVDIASVHLYPEHWNWTGDLVARGQRWITEHAQTGRPLILAEFGLENSRLPLTLRRKIYQSWFEAVRDNPSVAGLASWSFSTDDRPDDWDAYTWTWRNGTSIDDPSNRVADLHRSWAKELRDLSKTR